MKVLFFLLLPISIWSQSISNSVINTTGGFSENGNFSLTSSIGEVTTKTVEANNVIITQGFLQPNENSISTKSTVISTFNIYPNPTANQITIEGDLHLISKVLIINTLGQTVKTIENISAQVYLSNLSKGNYILRFFDKDNLNVQSYQIIKL